MLLSGTGAFRASWPASEAVRTKDASTAQAILFMGSPYLFLGFQAPRATAGTKSSRPGTGKRRVRSFSALI